MVVFQVSSNNYKRLSIFDSNAQQKIKGIYRDLSKYAYFEGLLFHDDGFLTDKEDVSSQALSYYKAQGMIFSDLKTLLAKQNSYQWAKIKTKALIDFTKQLINEVKFYNPNIKTARNIYAQPILNKDSISWFAQDLDSFIKNYDYSAIMAMPFLENASEPKRWLLELIQKLDTKAYQKDKLLIELQAKDWRSGIYLDESILLEQMRLLQQKGYINFGYYPDNFVENKPNLKQIISVISINTFPAGES